MTPSAPGERSREVRIGLVMYGGVSLAVYMNGVANEMFRAVRGRGVYKLFKVLTDSDVVVDVVSGASAGGINGMFLAYALCNGREFSSCANLWREQGGIMQLLRRPDSPPESQTSLLDSEGYYEPQLVGAFRTIWEATLEDPGDLPSPVKELDLFVVGTDFNGRLSTTVDSAAHIIDIKEHRSLFWLKHRQKRKHQMDPTANELGRGGTQMPSTSTASPSGEAQARTTLEAGFAAFAKLARITSCFPAAFAPVRIDVPPARNEGEEMPPSEQETVARKLGLWGSLSPGPYYFLDGGILDNKPFTSTIEAIFYRMASKPVQRHLIYVEPDPERFVRQVPMAPTFVSAAVDSLTRLPAYESIAGDLRLIAQHNEAIERYRRTCAELRQWVMRGQPASATGTAGTSVATAAEKTAGTPLGAKRAADAIYERARLQELGEMAADLILNVEEKTATTSDADKQQMADVRRAFDRALHEQVGDPQRLFSQVDVHLRLRRLMHLTYVLVRDDSVDPDVTFPADSATFPVPAVLVSADDVKRALLGIGRRIELLEVIEAQMVRAIETRATELRGLDPDAVWPRIAEMLAALLDVQGLPGILRTRIESGEDLIDADLEAISIFLSVRVKAAGASVATTTSSVSPPSDTSGSGTPLGYGESLLQLSDRGEARLVERFTRDPSAKNHPGLAIPDRPIQHEYDRFGELDRILFPIQFVGGLKEQDVIRVVRVSAHDAQRGLSKGNFADKVTGETLGHFGAFMKKSWRSNDILCGRLDGACQLIETLLNEGWLRASLGSSAQRDSVLLRMFTDVDMDPAGAADSTVRKAAIVRWLEKNAIFPSAGAKAVDGVARALTALLSPHATKAAFQDHVHGSALGELHDVLVEATHLDILATDYSVVIRDSVAEQLEWQTGVVAKVVAKVVARKDTATDAFDTKSDQLPTFDPETRAFDMELDDLAVAAAARQFANNALVGKQDPAELKELYRAYRVGAENIADNIPRTVLLEIVAQTLLVVRNCVLNSFGEDRAEAVRGSRIYKLFVDWPLRVFHALAVRMRKRPGQSGILLVLLGYFLVGLLANVVTYPKAIGDANGWRGSLGTVLFVALPLVCLVFLLALLSGSEHGRRGPGAALAAATRMVLKVVGLAVGAAAVLAPIYFASVYAEPLVRGWLTPALCAADAPPGDACTHAARVLVLLVALGVGCVVGVRIAGRQLLLYRRLARLLASNHFDGDIDVLAVSVVGGVSAGARVPTVKARKKTLLKVARKKHLLRQLEREMRGLHPNLF